MSVDTLVIIGIPGNNFTVPAGWTGYETAFRMLTSSSMSQTNDNFGQLVTNTVCSGVTIVDIYFNWQSNSVVEWAGCFINTSQTGFSVIIQGQNGQIRKEISGAGGDQLDTVSGLGIVDGPQHLQIVRDAADNSVVAFLNSIEILSAVYSDVTTGLNAGIQQYNAAAGNEFTGLSVENDVVTASIDTVATGGNPGFVVGEPFTYTKTGLGTVTGFTVKTGATPAAITSAINLTTGAGELKYWEDGVYYPFAGTVIATADDGTLTGTGSFTLSIPADQADVVFNTVETTDNTYLGNKLLAIGHPLANGDKGYYPPADGLVISPNSGVSSAIGATTFVLWVHKVSGIIERYDVVINDAGEITDVTGITSRGITSRGITSRNISKRGLG